MIRYDNITLEKAVLFDKLVLTVDVHSYQCATIIKEPTRIMFSRRSVYPDSLDN